MKKRKLSRRAKANMIRKIFTRDVKRLTTNVVAMIIVIGVVVLPALYAWFNIAANWDPYSNTSGLKVAVVNNDKGTTREDIDIDLGSEIVETLEGNDAIGWVFTDEEDAMEKVNSGEYYAAVVIPEDFSKNMSSILDDEVVNPELKYYVNQKANAIAPKITDKGATLIQSQVDQTFVSTVITTAAKALNIAASEFEENGDTITEKLTKSLNTIDKDLSNYINLVDAISSTADGVYSLMDSVRLSLPNVQNILKTGVKTISDSKEAMKSARTSINSMTDELAKIIASSGELFDQIGDAITKAVASAQSGAADAAANVSNAASAIYPLINLNNQIISALNSVSASLPEPVPAVTELISKLEKANEEYQSMIDKLNSVSAGITSSAATTAQLINEVSTLVQQTRTTINGILTTYQTGVKPKLDAMLDDLSQLSSDLSGLLTSIDSGLGNIDGVFDGLTDTLNSGEDALGSTRKALVSLKNRVHTLSTELSSIPDDERVEKLLDLMKTDPDIMGDFISSPVELTTVELYPIENYGSGMAPFYTTLAIWVGGVILIAMFKVTVDKDKELTNFTHTQAYFGRYLTYVVIGLLQATIICLGDLYFLKIQCENPFLFMLAGWISSFVFVNIMYALVVAFSDVGKALVVILLVLQIAGSGGTFPIQVLPQFFQNVYPFLPFTYAIDAMRETIGGMYGAKYWIDMLYLMIYVAASLLLGVVLRRPIIKLNVAFHKRMHDTHLL